MRAICLSDKGVKNPGLEPYGVFMFLPYAFVFYLSALMPVKELRAVD